MKRFIIAGAAIAAAGALTVTAVFAAYNAVTPAAFDPGKTYLASAGWQTGIGCPTDATVLAFQPPEFTTTAPEPYTDPACATGDTKDKKNEGLLLAKTGPTNNNASGTAELKGVKGTAVEELGYDIRKPDSAADPRGSHCGAGAPRFNVVVEGTGSAAERRYFIGCNSPAADTVVVGNGWLRLRWGGDEPLMAFKANNSVLTDISGMTVESIVIVFDEGQDTGPDNFGLAVLDNIDLNGALIGRGSPQ